MTPVMIATFAGPFLAVVGYAWARMVCGGCGAPWDVGHRCEAERDIATTEGEG